MHLLALTREFPGHVLGGISYHLAELYTELAALGHELTVVTGTCRRSRPELLDRAPPTEAIHTVRFGHEEGYYTVFPLALYRFLRSFDTSPYDACLVHTEVPFDVDLPVVAKKHDCYQTTRTFVRPEWPIYKRGVESLLNAVRRPVEARSVACADHLVFNSDLCRAAWNSHYSIEAPSSVVHNGVNTDRFYPRTDESYSPLVDPDREYVLFVGDARRKGRSDVLAFAPESPYEVVLVGPSSVGVAGATALGRVSQDELCRLYSGAVATIHPARFEAFGNVLLESVACGTPVVATEHCGAVELLDRRCCVVTDDLHAGVERARTLSRADCVEVAEGHTWAAVAEETDAIVQRVVSPRVESSV